MENFHVVFYILGDLLHFFVNGMPVVGELQETKMNQKHPVNSDPEIHP
jgi:hypothetical protein